MKEGVALIVGRLSNRPDSEHQQALIRLVIACMILAYLWGLQAFATPRSHIHLMFLVMLAESLVGLLLVAGIVIRPGVSHVRRWIGMLADYSTLAILMSVQADALAPLYVIILWVTIGNGLRYGNSYLYSAAALASLSFLGVILSSPFWRGVPYLAGGLWIGLVAIPGYLSRLLHDLNKATLEARRANAAKSRFLANMSHEFRSPLNSIIGMAELLHGTRLAPDQREQAEVILTSAQTLLLLVNDVLDISAIEAGKLQRKDGDFNLHDLVERLYKMLLPLSAEKGLALRTRIDEDVPLRLHGDGAHLTQILLNLMHNAIKFTEHGEVRLSIERLPGESDLRLRFSVRDTGIGVPAEAKERIFRAFEQVDNGPTRRFGGTGLGTTIAMTLTQLLGGRIGMEDNPGGGSHFWIELPMRTQEPAGEPVEVAASNTVVSFDDPFVRHKARVRSLRILVADDQQANRTVLTRILERAGHKVQAVNDGEQALDVLEQGNTDLAVVDMHMPRFTGLDVMRQLRFMQAGGKQTPVIVLSADATAQAIKDAEDAGAPAYLTKPVVVGRLLETIADLISPQKLPAVRPVGDIGIRSAVNSAVLEELAAMQLGENFLRDFVDQCLKDATSCLEDLNRFGSLRAWDEFRECAHALKGVTENIGAMQLTERCNQIMRASDQVLLKEQRKLLAELSTLLVTAAEQTRREVQRMGKSAKPRPDRAPGPEGA
jgi:two-component system sensor histidine kinase RpfC